MLIDTISYSSFAQTAYLSLFLMQEVSLEMFDGGESTAEWAGFIRIIQF